MNTEQPPKPLVPNRGIFKVGGRIDVKKSKAMQNKQACRKKSFKGYYDESLVINKKKETINE